MGPPRLGECVDGYAMAIRTSLLPSLLHAPTPPSGSSRAAGLAARGGSPLPTAHRTIPVTGVIVDASMGKGARHPRRGGERWAAAVQSTHNSCAQRPAVAVTGVHGAVAWGRGGQGRRPTVVDRSDDQPCGARDRRTPPSAAHAEARGAVTMCENT